MGWQDLDFDNLDSDVFQANRATLLAALAALRPELAFNSAAIDHLLLQPAAAVYTALYQSMTLLANSYDLAAVASGSTVDSTLVSKILSNYGIQKYSATKASGTLQIMVSEPQVILVDELTIFTSDYDYDYRATSLVRAIPSEEYRQSDDDVLMVQYGDLYGFQVPVEADQSGADYNVAAGCGFSTEYYIPGLVRIFAASDISGGQDEESDQQAASRALSGLGVKGFGSKLHLLNLIRYGDQSVSEYYDSGFANVVDVAALGARDAEMLRDKRGLLPVALGGKLDVYVKSSANIGRFVESVEAELVDIVGGHGVWEITLDAQNVPGAYRVIWVNLPSVAITETSFEILSHSWDYDTSQEGFPFTPDIESAVEAVFSPFQKLYVRFVDTETSVDPGEVGSRTETYTAVVEALPYLADIQKHLTDDSCRPPTLDVLVRAPWPCYVGVSVELSDSSTTIAELARSAVVACIGNTAIGEVLTSSEVAVAIGAALGELASVKDVQLSGTLWTTSGPQTLVGGYSLEIPTIEELGLSAKNTAFFTSRDDISVSL